MSDSEEKKVTKEAGAPKAAPESKSNESGGNKGILIVLILLVVALGGGLIFLYLENQELKNTTVTQEGKIQTQDGQIKDQMAELESVRDEYDRILKEREAMGLSNDSLMSELDGLNAKIRILKSRTATSEADKKKLEREIKALKAKHILNLTKKDEEIAMLRDLSDSLKTNIDSLVGERSNMLAENATLEDKVALASVLQADDLKVTVINSKEKELEKDEYKAKLVSKVKVAFKIGKNAVSPKGPKEMFMLLRDPAGTVLFDINKGGGAFTEADGNQEFYSQKAEVEFNNEAEHVTFLYEVDEEIVLVSGSYKIEIWESGYSIGTTTLVVK